MAKELEIRFPYQGTYIDAGVYDYTSRWLFKCGWQHVEFRVTINPKNLPENHKALANFLKRKAVRMYWKAVFKGFWKPVLNRLGIGNT